MMGQWSGGRVSSGFQSYLSRKAAWTIIYSGEEKVPLAGPCLVSYSGSLRNVLLSCIIVFTIYSLLAFGLAFWSHLMS